MGVIRSKKYQEGKSARPSGNPLWDDAPSEVSASSVLLEIWGEPGTGKTTLALSAPGPIAIFHAQEKLRGIVEPHYEKIGPNGDGTQGMHNFGFSKTGPDVEAQCKHIMSKFYPTWDNAFTWARTIIVDTHTALWEAMRLARFGTLTPQGDVKRMYGPANAEWFSTLTSYREDGGTNLILIGQGKEEYKNDKPTGKIVRAGQNQMLKIIDVGVRTSRGKKGEFLAEIDKGWFNASSEGTVFEDDEISFPDIMSFITDMEAEEWDQ